MTKTVRVGNAGGYWGDDPDALRRQLTQGPLDYVTLDFLAEITMSILQQQRARRPELGYATDFVDQMRRCLPLLPATGTRIITNAGGINPDACAREIDRIARKEGIEIKIAIVSGDDLTGRIDELLAKGMTLENMETSQPLESIRERVETANAYLGAAPVVKALELGAQIVITGRVTDTGLTAAPPIFEFGWSLNDWDRLAAAVIAGHIMECGAQAAGGNLTDWREVPSWVEMGYPVVEFLSDGTFYVTKHQGTGGVVNGKTVTEQLVYEMGDPHHYITPDVIADFSSITLAEESKDRVKISGARGRPRTPFLKVSISYHDGYKAHGTLLVSRPEAVEKCKALADMFWNRLALGFEETGAELVGYNAAHFHLVPAFDPPEILLRLGVRDRNRDHVEEFAKQFTSLILSGPPGVAIVGARPRLQEVVAYWPCLVPAAEVTPEVTLLGAGKTLTIPWLPVDGEKDGKGHPEVEIQESEAPDQAPPQGSPQCAGERVRIPLSQICYARSGDKGDTCNIGVVARSAPIYAWLCQELTAEQVKAYFGEICRGNVERFEVPNLLALNFLLHQSLGGGGTVSLRVDPQGKTLACALLMMEVDVPKEWICETRNIG